MGSSSESTTAETASSSGGILGPVLKPSYVGNWGTRVAPNTADYDTTSTTVTSSSNTNITTASVTSAAAAAANTNTARSTPPAQTGAPYHRTGGPGGNSGSGSGGYSQQSGGPGSFRQR